MSTENPVQNQAYYLGEIQRLLRRDLSSEQSFALKHVLDRVVRVPSEKIINLNIRFWLFTKLYLQIYVGEEKRDRKRRKKDVDERKRLNEYKERDAEYYFRLLPEDTSKEFNFEESRLIKDVLNRAIKIPTKKIFEGNISFKLKKKYYLAFFLGFDRRKNRRPGASLMMDRMSIFGSIVIYAIVIAFVAYFGKTVMNYDIIEGQHAIDYLLEKSGLLK